MNDKKLLRAEAAGLHGLIDEALDLMGEGNIENRFILNSLASLKERLNSDRFHMAVLGQFKRGKSTFLNSLLGYDLLPGAVLPVTALPVFIQYSNEYSVKIKYNDGRESEFKSESPAEINRYLAEFVSEEMNPENRLDLKGVELLAPAEILKHGLVLIDTPGVGSTHLHNTEVTMNVLSQCDAALFLFSPDPPVTEVELEFLREVKSRVKKIFFVLNKVDYLNAEDVPVIKDFIRKVLHEKGGFPEPLLLFPVSAKMGLLAAESDNESLWYRSGMGKVKNELVDFLVNEKREVFERAVSLKAAVLIDEFLSILYLAKRSLEIPLHDFKTKTELFKAKIVEAHDKRKETSDILNGDQRRFVFELEEQSRILRERAFLFLKGIIEKHLANSKIISENEVRIEFSESIPLFFEQELGAMSRTFNELVDSRMSLHEKGACDLVESVKSAASEIFEIPLHKTEGKFSLAETKKPYWVTHSWSSSFIPVPEDFFDRVLPRKIRIKRITERLVRQADYLALTNVENLRWNTRLNMDETFRKFSREFDERFDSAVEATEKALSAALKWREDNEDSIDRQAGEIGTRINDLKSIIDRLKGEKE